MSTPYRISSDPYADEVMSVQREDDGTFYVEIPELEWCQGGFADPVAAAEAGRQRAIIAIGKTSESREEIEERIVRLQAKVDEMKKEIPLREAAIRDWRESLRRERNLSEGLKELPEDEARILHAMNYFSDESPWACQAIGFRLHKDVDGDGDMDHAFVLWSHHKKLVSHD